MAMTAGEEREALWARLEDLCARAARGEVVYTPFLSEKAVFYAASWLKPRGIPYAAYGGYADAERKRIWIFPDYMEEAASEPDFMPAGLSAYGAETDIASLRITGSCFATLSHRDFLGALLGLGIERDVLGDICVGTEGKDAVLFCDRRILPFLLSELKKIGRDTVRVQEIVLPADFRAERRMAPVSDTIASPRLDCVVAALCGLSRERARECVAGGLAELDYETELRPDRSVTPPCVLSVRGYGKFRVLSTAGQTKKGRYRLSAEKYL